MNFNSTRLINKFIDDQLADHRDGTAGHDFETLRKRCIRRFHAGEEAEEITMQSASKAGWTCAASLYIVMLLLCREKELHATADRFKELYGELELSTERRKIIDKIAAKRLA